MGEENMNNQQQEENLVIDSSTGKDNPKSNKSIIIIISAVVSLIVIALVVYFIIANQVSQFALEIENNLNAALKRQKQDLNDGFTYEPFKCKGSTSITCKSGSITITDGGNIINAKNNVFKLVAGSTTTADIIINSDVILEIVGGDNKKALKQTIRCVDKAELKSADSYVINNIKCDMGLENIETVISGTIYAQSDIFSEEDFIAVGNKIKSLEMTIPDTIDSIEYAVDKMNYNIASDNLGQDMIDIYNRIMPSSKAITLDEALESIQSLRATLALYSSSKSDENKIVHDGLDAIAKVLQQESNYIEIDVKLKEGKDIDDTFFLGVEFDLYDISVISK